MIKHLIKADPVAWEQAFTEFKSSKRAMDGLDGPLTESPMMEALERYYAAESALLNLPSPHIGALIEKLLIIWDDEIRSDDEGDHQKRMIIGDLHRFQILNGL